MIYKEIIKFNINNKEKTENIFYGNKTIIYPEKDRIENYIILTSLKQLNFLNLYNEIFIYSTFKVVSKNFYQ